MSRNDSDTPFSASPGGHDFRGSGPASQAGLGLLLMRHCPPLEIRTNAFEQTQTHCKATGWRARPCPADLLHVSIAHLGYYPEPPQQTIRRICSAMQGFCARPIVQNFDRTALFGRNKDHLVLAGHSPDRDFQAMCGLVLRRLRRANFPCGKSASATPHLTVIYDRNGTPLMPVLTPISWIADNVVLVFRVGQVLTEYGRWTLDPQAEPYPRKPVQLTLDLPIPGSFAGAHS